MDEILPYDPGSKIALYRKKLKLSAEQLADRAGFGLTRAVIANLENGRKDDVTVRQLMAIAFVLQVSPVDLVFDLEKPYHRMEITNGEGNESSAAVWLMRDWFGGTINGTQLNATRKGSREDAPIDLGTPEQMKAHSLRRRSDLLLEIDREEKLQTGKRERLAEHGLSDTVLGEDVHDRHVRGMRAELYAIDNALKAQGVDLSHPIHPTQPV